MSKADTKERIVAAALEVFSREGSAATTREIAKCAQVNEVTLFRHFGNKERLLQAVIEQFSTMGMLTEQLNEQLTGELRHDLFLLGETYLDRALARSEQIRLGVQEAPRNPELARMFGQIPERLTAHLAAHFQSMHRKGTIGKADFTLLAHLFYSMLFQNVIAKTYLPETLNYMDDPDRRNHFIHSVVELFVSRLEGTPPGKG